jgi:hypothetical protein
MPSCFILNFRPKKPAQSTIYIYDFIQYSIIYKFINNKLLGLIFGSLSYKIMTSSVSTSFLMFKGLKAIFQTRQIIMNECVG